MRMCNHHLNEASRDDHIRHCYVHTQLQKNKNRQYLIFVIILQGSVLSPKMGLKHHTVFVFFVACLFFGIVSFLYVCWVLCLFLCLLGTNTSGKNGLFSRTQSKFPSNIAKIPGVFLYFRGKNTQISKKPDS